MFLQAEQPDHSEGLGSSYRAYEIGTDGRVRASIPIDAASDEDAVAQTRNLSTEGLGFELWDRSRPIIKLSNGQSPEGR